MEKEQSFEYLMVVHCAPTLAGIKTASMFNVSCKEEKPFFNFWREKLEQKGLGMQILKNSEKKALVYVYRKDRLEKLLMEKEIQDILKSCGYEGKGSSLALENLKKRMKERGCFPHEIGLFLGYPAEDVIGFIENRGKNCALCGYWKVYCNQHQAMQTFALYNKCRDLYQMLFAQGVSVLQMIAG